MTDNLRYAMPQGPHPATLQQSALGESTKSIQVPFSIPVPSPPPIFHTHMDGADMEFLQKKLGECKGRRENPLFSAVRPNPYIKIVAVLEQSPRDGSGAARTEPLLKQVQTDREKRLIVGT